MACKYLFNNKQYSYSELLDELSKTDLESAFAMLFSLLLDKQATTVDAITNLKKEYKLKASSGAVGANAAFNFDEDGDILVGANYTTQTFIDSGHFNLDGTTPGFRLNADEYFKHQKDMYINQGLSEDDADYKCQLIKSKWDIIAKDATDLHRILLSADKDAEDRDFLTLALKTSFLGIYDKLKPVRDLIWKDMYKHNAGSTPITNVNLEAQIRNLAEYMVGHIDYLFVRPDGDIEIFNLKVSKDSELEWSEAKKDKYKYQLAFLKRILEYNGINAKNIRVNLVPVKLEYDDTFDNVVGISTQPPVSYDTRGAKYTMLQYDNIVALYMDSNAEIEPITEEVFINVNRQLDKIFSGRNIDIRYEGIKESAKGWTKKNWNHIATQAVGKKGWEIKFPGEKQSIYVEDTKVGADNEEVVAMVQAREEQLFGNTARQKGTYRIIADIRQSYENHLPFFGTSDTISDRITTQLDKYFSEYDSLDESGKVKNYNWTLIDNDTLLNSNILLFKNRLTNLLDVVTFTPFDVDSVAKAKGRDNLLGLYLTDMNNKNFTMESNYGNIEAIRTMTLLNAVIPNLGKVDLGQLKIVGLSPYHRKSGKEFTMSQLLPNFDTIVKTVNENNSSLGFVNNFKQMNILAVDPAHVLIQTWHEAMTNYPEQTRKLKDLEKIINDEHRIDGTTIDGLQSTTSIEGKLEKLHRILEMIKTIDQSIVEATPEKLLQFCKDERKDKALTARMYVAALRAISVYNGDLAIDNEEFSQMSEYLLKPQIIPNTNVRTVGYMFQRSIDKISGDMLDRYSPIRTRIMKYFEDKGYSTAQNSLLGNHASQFKDLYEEDLQGNRTMNFKNPYDPTAQLSNLDREFLKDMLYELNKIRFEMRGLEWKYSGVNDKNLILDVNTNNADVNYLAVPLMRVSDATKHEDMGKNIKDFGKRWMKRIMHPKDAFKEFTEGMLSDEEKARRDDDIRRLLAYNPFIMQELNANTRANYIADKGVDYFETDLETIMVNFMEKHIQSTEFNKMLTRTKGILLDLQMRGIAEDDPKGIEHTVKTINDYLSVSVFNKSIMEESTQAVEAFLDPIRRAVTKCYIAANPTAMVRDTIEGLWQNMSKALIKFQTDIDISDVAHGYAEVVKEGPGNLMKITKLNLLNLKYRFSNLDIARISEGLKTSGGGVLNAGNWAYVTLRAPDYLNRMVLFSARMHHDGVEDAYVIRDGKLEYDWTLDHRFDVYRANRTNDPKFNEQRSLYLSLLRAFNQENNTNLQEGDALPDAYTSLQIAQFKNFADTIYGSYNQSTRAKYENVALGRNFGVFSTWMNGIVDVYAKKRQISNSESKWEQERDANGNLLFFDKDGNILARELDENGEPITMLGDVPVMTDVPLMVLGVFYTLGSFAKEWYNNGWDAAKQDIWGNEVNRRNLKRMLSDMLIWMILGGAFKLFIDGQYAEHKTNGRGLEVIKNGLIEVTYNAAHNSFDGFKGPFAVLDYVGNSTNPATYKLQTKVLNDLGSFIMGDKTFTGLMMGSLALPRAFKDTYRMWVRDTL